MARILSELREATGLSQRELARIAGLHQSTIQKYEKGERELSTELMAKISAIMAERIQIAYVAGLFDRNSNWDIIKVLPNQNFERKPGQKSNTGPTKFPNYSPRVRFTTKYKMLAKVLEHVFGGGFSHSHNQTTDSWTFFAANKKAKMVAEKLLPYLVLKRREAEIIIEANQILNPLLGKSTSKKPNKNCSPVLCVEPGLFFESVSECSRRLKINTKSIHDCLRGKQKTAGGMSFIRVSLNDYLRLYPEQPAEDTPPPEYLLLLEKLHKEIRSKHTKGKYVKNG